MELSKAEDKPLNWNKTRLKQVDWVLIVVLWASAFAFRAPATKGDLWFDEADYAFAAMRGFEANRLDKEVSAADPEKLVRYRHFHPPGIAYLIQVGLTFSYREQAVRACSLLIGCGSVVLMYLCGLLLFGERRKLAFLVALMLVLTPADIRASSHAISWSYIVFCLLALFWTMLQFLKTRHVKWIWGGWVALAGMYTVSEFFLPILLIAILCAPSLYASDWKNKTARKRLLVANGAGLLLFLGLAWIFWPAGLTGGALKMLEHYVKMADSSFPTTIGGHVYAQAPKWAYLYWYVRSYPVFAVIYLTGLALILRRLFARRVSPEFGVLIVFTLVITLVAHKAHIIHTSYLVHALPFLTLCGGFAVILLERWRVHFGYTLWIGALILNFASLHVWRGRDMDLEARSRIERWAEACRFLAPQLEKSDVMLAHAFGSPARWYLVHEPTNPNPVQEWQIQALPEEHASAKLICDLERGRYRFVGIGSTFNDTFSVDPGIRKIVEGWKCIWKSDERGTGTPRLLIYEFTPKPH